MEKNNLHEKSHPWGLLENPWGFGGVFFMELF